MQGGSFEHASPSTPKTRVTLRDRTLQFNESMLAKRNLANPRSENLSVMVSPIVSSLEKYFDTIDQRFSCKPNLNSVVWKQDAFRATLDELPKIAYAGTETGPQRGYGAHMYVNPAQRLNVVRTAPKHLMNENGKWKNNVELRLELAKTNPTLPRSVLLRACSGRYVWSHTPGAS